MGLGGGGRENEADFASNVGRSGVGATTARVKISGGGSEELMTAVSCCESSNGDTGGLAKGFSGYSSTSSGNGEGRGEGDGDGPGVFTRFSRGKCSMESSEPRAVCFPKSRCR